jgi:hypothetical protein
LKVLEGTGKWLELNIHFNFEIYGSHNLEFCIIYKIMFENAGQCRVIPLTDNEKEKMACMSEF